MLRQRHQLGDSRLGAVGIFRMHPDRRQDHGIGLGHGQYAGKIFQRDADAHGARDAVFLHQINELRQVFGEIGKIDVAV
ncbi:hypothetical protein D3C72_2423080 [compost metagenome]